MVKGEITQDLGESSITLLFLRVDSIPCQQDADPEMETCSESRTSPLPVTVRILEFSDGDNSVTILDKSGKLSASKGEITVQGVWTEDEDGSFYIFVSD